MIYRIHDQDCILFSNQGGGGGGCLLEYVCLSLFIRINTVFISDHGDVLMSDFNPQLLFCSSNCDYRLQTSLIDCRRKLKSNDYFHPCL